MDDIRSNPDGAWHVAAPSLFREVGFHMARGRKGTPQAPGLEGLDALVRTIGERLGEALGAALVGGIETGVRRAGGLSRAVQAATGAPVPGGASAVRGAAGPGCQVPECLRTAVAKGLCATHYRKARRLKMGPTFGRADLDALAEDGRKTRFGSRR
jgi:hypothetical protein